MYLALSSPISGWTRFLEVRKDLAMLSFFHGTEEFIYDTAFKLESKKIQAKHHNIKYYPKPLGTINSSWMND